MNAQHYTVPTMIIDNFFADPDAIRQRALSFDFHDSDWYTEKLGKKETWPGLRTASLHEIWPELLSELMNQVLSGILRLPPCDYRAASSFQICYASDGDSWVHTDDGAYQMAGLIYLTPNPAPNSGTILYEQGKDDNHRERDIIGNVYNRLIIYNSQTLHKSNVYFGDSKETGRMTLPFFVDFWLKGQQRHA